MSGVRRCSRPGCTDRVVGRRLCRKHYQAAWKAGDFTNAPLLPRKPARVVCPPEHKHGAVSTCYIQHQCRCTPCRDAHALMTRRRIREKAYGRFDRGVVDAGPVREHMVTLGEFGIGYNRAAALAGVGITAARNLIWGRQEPGPRYGELQKHVKRETAERLLAVQPVLENLAAGATTSARASVRRIQTLIAFGWSQERLAGELGMLGSNLSGLRLRYEKAARRGRGATVRVSARTALAIAAMYERLSVTPPPEGEWREKIAASRARGIGLRNGWALPMDWEAYDNDFDRSQPVRRSLTEEKESA
jgi:hypothetical protein